MKFLTLFGFVAGLTAALPLRTEYAEECHDSAQC